MLHPSQFQVNEAWVVFQLNDAPIRTEEDGAFNCVGLMDAASCFILGAEFVPVGEPEPSELEARRLLEAGWAHGKVFPATLFVPNDRFQTALTSEAKRRAIAVIPVHESQLLVFIGEARQGFKQHIEGGREHGDSRT